MLAAELECFGEVGHEFQKLQSSFADKVKRRTELTAELQKVDQSPQATYGIFTRVPKEEMLAQLRTRLATIESEVAVEERLLALAADYIVASEIPYVKARKTHRFEAVMLEFSNARIRQLEQEIVLWRAMSERGSAERNAEALDHRLLQGQMRITQLRPVTLEQAPQQQPLPQEAEKK